MRDIGPLWQVSDAVMALTPVNLATGANTGVWLNMANVNGMNFIVPKGIGASGEPVVITFEQAKDSSGTGAKAIDIKFVAYKVAASTTIAAATDIWVPVTSIDPDNPVSSYTGTSQGDKEAVYGFFFRQQDLDTNNGFTYIRIKIADVGATAQIGAVLAIPSGRVYKGGPLKTSLMA